MEERSFEKMKSRAASLAHTGYDCLLTELLITIDGRCCLTLPLDE